MTKKARKSNRPNLPQETLARARQELYGSPEAEPRPVKAKREAPAGAPVGARKVKPVQRETNLREEYAYVAYDLRNMGILAAALMAVLIILSFFI
jgi:hypothetical protein